MHTKSVLLVLVALLASPLVAQATTDPADEGTTTAAATPSETPAPDDTDNDTSLPPIDQSSTTEEEESTAPPLTTSAPPSSTPTDAVPTISTDNGSLPPLPTIPGQYSYPPPAVPPTNNAPFMQPSSVPQGTLFIVVGAILGAFGATVLIWRAIVACLLHRSVKKAAMAQHLANDKVPFPGSSTSPYKYHDHASSASLGNLAAGRGVRRTQRGPIPSATPSQSNLFFSPTAAAGSGNAANRESRFLPSGFYAAGAGAPPGHGHSISLTNLRPDSRGVARAMEPSPPESPNLAPRSDMSRRNPSSSTLNLHRPPSGRTPSAYLEDLLMDQPEQFPPQGNSQTWNQPHHRM